MTFVKQLHQKLTKLKEEGVSREELEQIFDKVLEEINKSNLSLYGQFKLNPTEYTKRGKLAKDMVFEEVYTETMLKQIQGGISNE